MIWGWFLQLDPLQLIKVAIVYPWYSRTIVVPGGRLRVVDKGIKSHIELKVKVRRHGCQMLSNLQMSQQVQPKLQASPLHHHPPQTPLEKQHRDQSYPQTMAWTRLPVAQGSWMVQLELPVHPRNICSMWMIVTMQWNYDSLLTTCTSTHPHPGASSEGGDLGPWSGRVPWQLWSSWVKHASHSSYESAGNISVVGLPRSSATYTRWPVNIEFLSSFFTGQLLIVASCFADSAHSDGINLQW